MSVLNQSPPTELVDEDEIDGAGRRVGVGRRQASLLGSNIHQDEGQSYLSWRAGIPLQLRVTVVLLTDSYSR